MPSGSNAMAVTAILINKPVMYIVFGILLGIKGWCFILVIRTIPESEKPKGNSSVAEDVDR
jgi:hypothetical protein